MPDESYSLLGNDCFACLADNARTMEDFGLCAGAAVMSDNPGDKMAECDEKYDVTVCDSLCGCKY